MNITRGLLAAAVIPLGLHHAPIHVLRLPNGVVQMGPRNSFMSSNWSGYAVHKFQTGKSYAGAASEWTVPTVSYGQSTDSVYSPEYTSTWVGIGGSCEDANCSTVDQTLIQLGTIAEVAANGETAYFAWYEVLPALWTPLPASYVVKPGDRIFASLKCVKACQQSVQTWSLSMTDQTRGWTWTQTLRYGSSMLSAEWIEEAPMVGGGITPLPRFSEVPFLSVPGDGDHPSLVDQVNAIVLTTPWGQTAAPSPAAVLSDFAVCYGFESVPSCGVP